MDCQECDGETLCQGCELLALARQASSSGAEIPSVCLDWALRHLDKYQSQEILFSEKIEDLILATIRSTPDSANPDSAAQLGPDSEQLPQTSAAPAPNQSGGSGIQVKINSLK